MPGAYVFPGGVVEEADYAAEMSALCCGLDFDRAHRIIRDASPPEKSLGFYVAAIRESFEESGILLVHGNAWEGRVEERQMRWLTEHRAEVHADPPTFVARLGEEALNLATDRLFYFAHWITPEASPIRFDARFFIAAAPADQDAHPDGKETVEARWISPQDALAEHRRGRLMLAPPTFHSLAEMAEFRTADEAIASTHSKRIETRYG